MTSDDARVPVAQDAEGQAEPRFADLARPGANAAWRYVSAVFLVFAGGTALALLAGVALYLSGHETAVLNLANPDLDMLATRPIAERLIGFAFLLWGVIAYLPVARFVLPWLHRRPWRTFLTAALRFRFGRAVKSCAIMIMLGGLGVAFQLAFAPESVRVQAPDIEMALVAALGIVLLPWQVLTEELIFRGYLTQLTGRLTASTGLRIIVPAILFTLAHASNPETMHDPAWAIADYALAALYLGILAWRGNGLEDAVGLHFAINLFVLVVASPSVSVFQTKALVTDINSDFRIGFIASCITFIIHYSLMYGFARPKTNAASP